MARINNPRKAFQFSITITGIQPFLVQSVKIPDVELDTDEHGDAGFKVKTPGMANFGLFSISKIVNQDSTLDRYVWDVIAAIRPLYGGVGQIPSVFKRNILVEQFANDGITVLQRWEMEGCWPKRINGVEFNRAQSGNTVENIDFELDRMRTF